MTGNGLIIVGAGGHAKVVTSTALVNHERVIGLVDDDISLINKKILGAPVLGKIDQLKQFPYENLIFGIGHNQTRKNIISKSMFPNTWATLIHSHAYVHPSAVIGAGSVIFAGAVIQPDVQIGQHCIINTGATIDHDCVLGDFVHLAPGVHLAGGVSVGDGCFLGIGSAVIPGVTIGHWAVVAAGGVVIDSISADKIVMGIPARERRYA